MAPESVFKKARDYLHCNHRLGSIIIEDAYEINANDHQCVAMCAICGRICYIHLTRKEWKQMDNRAPWSEDNHKERI